MKLNPQQAPLYGRCVITVQLCDEELAQDEEGVDYFLLFAGSTQRHLTSTLRSSHDTLQALCPAHDCCEEVWVTLCSIKRGVPEAPEDPRACPGPVTPLAEHRFCFVQDLAFDMAQFLVSTAGRADGLEGALMLDECQIPLQECERLDESLALALDHLRLPPGWSLLGNKKNNSTDLDPQETLLHFAARRGLTRVALFLLQQAGAREALQLPNRQGHTPSAIAALREHHHLHQLLTQAGVDTEKDVGTETAHPVSADSRVVCHLPRLNTHTLTLGIYPDRNPPTLQRIVEQLQHLICHLHAKGVSTLDLQSEFLHTGTECCDGVGTETAFSERLKQTTTASEHLHSSTEESWIKNGLEDGSRSSVGGGDGEAGNEERDWELCASPSTSVKRPPDHGLGPPEDWVCLNPNTERDYSREEEEEGREQLVFADQSLTLCDRSEEAQSETEGESLAVGTPPTAACGKQTEETDRGDAVIREGQEATEGKERAQQEAEESTARREEEKEEEEAKKKEGINLESKDPTAHSGNTTVSAMGQSQSLENSEESDTSDSDMKDCSKEVGDLEEEMRYNQELCDRISLDREKPESEGLMDPTSTPEDLPNRSLIECGDVMQEEPSESAGQCPVIVGLHKGEPPLDINSLEQNQETAVRDYSTVQQWDLADGCSYLAPETECHFGDCTGADSDKELDRSMSTSIDEQATVPRADIGSASLPLNEPDNLEETYVQNTADFQTAGNSVDSKGTYLLDSEASSEIMPSSGKGYADLDSGTTQGFSSDEEDSFRSVGSSTTEIFQSTQEPDRPNMEEQDPIKTNTEELVSVGNKMAEQDDMKPGESNEHLLAVAPGLPSDHSTVSILTVTDCGQAGSEPESQLSPSLHTIEPLSLEGTGEKLAPEISKEDMSLGLVLSESGDRPTVKVAESQCESAEDNDSKPNLETLEEHSESEVTDRVLFELKPSVAEGTEITGSAEEDTRPTETSNNLEEVLAKDSGETDLQLVLQQLGGENSEMTANERSVETDADEGLRHSSIQISMLSSEDITSNSADVTGAGTEPLPAGDGAFSEPPTEEVLSSEEVTESPRLPDAMDGASYCHFSPIQEMDVDVSEDLGDGPREDKDGPEVEEDSSMIHRDKEASFLQPSNTQLTGSSQSTSPSLTSITSRTTSYPSTTHRDSGSDTESFLGIEAGDDSVFRKGDVPVTGGDSTSEVSVSCSSTDDTASVCPSSSSPEGSQGLGCSWSPEESSQTGSSIAAGLGGGGGAGAGGGGEAEDEAKDRVTEVPRRLLRPSVRSLSPLRRHSWGPGKNNGGDAEMNQRSSIRSPGEGKPTFHRRSYSLEGLSEAREQLKSHRTHGPHIQEPPRLPRQESEERGSLGSLVSLTEEQEEVGEHSGLDEQKSRRYRPLRQNFPPMTLPLTKSVSMLAISQRDIDAVGRLRRKRRISFSFNLSPILNKSKSQLTYQDFSSSDDEDNLSMRSFSSTSGSVAYSISEEEPGPLRSDTEGKSVTKVSRTFSYLKNKMYKKTREKDREKREKDKEGKEKDKRTVNGHLFTPISSVQATQCSQCNKALNAKEAFHCTHCNACVHKSCRDGLPACAKVKMKFPRQQFAVPDSSSVPTVTMRNKSTVTRERPWSAILSPEDHSSLAVPSSRRHTSIMPFHGNNLSKSLSISNIAGPVFDDMPIKGLRYLSQSTDSLNRTNQVTESMESLTDEGTEMMDGQLMGEFEAEVKELEADSWSFSVDQQYLQQLDRELVKRQDVIYELMQTEMHHIRTLRIMSEVYSKGLQKEVQLEAQTLERLFPVLDELLEIHTQHLLRLLERKRESQLEGGCLEGGFIINRIGDILVSQFSGSNAESMKRVYGRFCSRHNEAVHFYKELLTKEKRFKAFIKKKMSSTIVRRLGIPECILLVTQRITKYPVLFQRLLQHTKVGEEDYDDLTDAVRLVKEVIAAVDGKVNEHEKKRRLKEFHSRMDSKSIMMMKSGQMFAREDLLRRRLFHDGALQLKNSQGRLKDVHALLLSDVLVFLQEKDQKYVFALLDQRSTVISLQKLIVREVANEERGLFLITAGIEKPEMMEVLASSKEERNTWMQLIQGAMQSIEKDEDEGIPSETEDDKRQLETKAKEMRDMLRQKDAEIMSLLEEKVKLFRGMWEGLNPAEDACRQVEPFFRSACGPEPPRGATIMRDALQEVETLQELVNGSLGGAMASVQEGGGAGSVCLPRRAETFGGFDSHQMSSSKNGDKDEGEDMASDLRRTESDSVLKKGGNANLLLLLKRNSEQVLHSVSNLHLLLSTLQAVVVQQDSFIEDQRQALSERSSSCTSLSRPSSRPSSLIEQEKQRSLEKQRQELASLQRQQAAHVEEKRRREKDWELREEQLTEREMLLHVQEEEIWTRNKDIEEEKQELQSKKEEYQRDLERLRDAQRKLDREREAVQRQLDKMEELRLAERTPSSTSDDSPCPGSSQSLELDLPELDLPSLQPHKGKPKGKNLNPFTLSSANPGLKSSETPNQVPNYLLQLAKNKGKDRKEKKEKKKKSKGGSTQTTDPQHLPEPPLDGEIFFC